MTDADADLCARLHSMSRRVDKADSFTAAEFIHISTALDAAAARIEALGATVGNINKLYGEAMDNCRELADRAEKAEAELAEARRDAERLDFLELVAAVEIFTIPSQHIRANTVREAIDAAIAKLLTQANR